MGKKRNILIVSIFILSMTLLITITLIISIKVVTPKLSYLFEDDSNYRAEGTTAAGNVIKIDDIFYVVTTSAVVSSLYYDEENGEKYIQLVEYVYKLNYDENYIIIQSITKNFYSTFFKEFEYAIVTRESKEVIIIKDKDEFLKECKKRNIKVELKYKEQFDWY